MKQTTRLAFNSIDHSIPKANSAFKINESQNYQTEIHGALGTVSLQDNIAPQNWTSRLKTLLAILGPGLIVMVGDNDAGAFATYAQAGQNYSTSLLWTLLFLIPVLFVNQDMVLRLGAVSRVGHAQLILKRFGKFWGAFSVIDLFILNALTIITEFIGISFGLDFLGVSKIWGVLLSAAIIILAASTGSFRRFERFSLFLVLGSLLLIPVFLIAHPSPSQIAHDLFVPHMPKNGAVSDVMLLIIAIVGTTVAPWQLFFQQSYIIDKKITSRFVNYERIDLIVGIFIVVAGAIAMIAFCAQIFNGSPDSGKFTNTEAIAVALNNKVGHVPAILFALALIDACIIGAASVSLSTAYALGDVLNLKHSLRAKPKQAKCFYAIYVGLICCAALCVLIPGSPLGLLTEAVQTLAGILLPSATVFLLLLCNDHDVLGPWVNSKFLNIFSGVVVAVLVMLSVILTAAVLYPQIGSTTIWSIFAIGGIATLAIVLIHAFKNHSVPLRNQEDPLNQHWQMPPLENLAPMQLTKQTRLWMSVLRIYLFVACGLLGVKITQLAIGH